MHLNDLRSLFPALSAGLLSASGAAIVLPICPLPKSRLARFANAIFGLFIFGHNFLDYSTIKIGKRSVNGLLLQPFLGQY
ncbi:MAG: hypothetical protein WAN43_00295 [Rhodomicrobium sp.]